MLSVVRDAAAYFRGIDVCFAVRFVQSAGPAAVYFRGVDVCFAVSFIQSAGSGGAAGAVVAADAPCSAGIGNVRLR